MIAYMRFSAHSVAAMVEVALRRAVRILGQNPGAWLGSIDAWPAPIHLTCWEM